MSTKFLVLSDTHYIGVNPKDEVDAILNKDLKGLDYDIALLAGDIGVTDEEIKDFLETHFKGKQVCFLGGNHIVYIPGDKRTLSEINQHHKETYPLNSNWSFMENDYKIIGNNVIIGCNLYTDYKYHSYKEYRTVLDEQGRRLDKKGNVLPEDPTKTEEFRNKFKAIWDDETTTVDEKDKLMKDLYHSVCPDNNERVDTSFKNRVSEEVYNNYIGWQESFGKEAKKEFSQKDYIYLNKNYALRCMNDFRYGKIADKKYKFLDGSRRLDPRDYEKMHKESLKYIDKIYKQFENTDYNIIVMTHHCPSTKCITPVYEKSELNASFVSDLDTWIYKHPKIKLWVCGHVHSTTDTYIGNTRLTCSPMGYIAYNEHIGFEPYVIEI